MEPVKIQKEKIMSVYARKDTPPPLPDPIKPEDEALSKRIAVQFLWDVTSPIVFLFLWNWSLPGLFVLATIGYFKAFGIVVMSRILFKHDSAQ